ncbi:unnamed protein product, partial [Iphiclides podalirius]
MFGGSGAGGGGYGEGGEGYGLGYVGGGRLQQYAHFAPHQNVWHHHHAAHHDSYEAIRGVAGGALFAQCTPRPLTDCSCRDLSSD